MNFQIYYHKLILMLIKQTAKKNYNKDKTLNINS